MPRPIGSRWAFLALPLLVGALLLMHGLDTGSTESGAGTGTSTGTTHAAAHGHDGSAPDSHDDGHCASCDVAHLLAACVAVLATIATFVAAHRLYTRGTAIRRMTSAPRRRLHWRDVLRPPEPAWVRLAVMRC
jgi:hypothetical protein